MNIYETRDGRRVKAMFKHGEARLIIDYSGHTLDATLSREQALALAAELKATPAPRFQVQEGSGYGPVWQVIDTDHGDRVTAAFHYETDAREWAEGQNNDDA